MPSLPPIITREAGDVLSNEEIVGNWGFWWMKLIMERCFRYSPSLLETVICFREGGGISIRKKDNKRLQRRE